jgi:Zn-dependent M28 family amino/carboxypeptidase
VVAFANEEQGLYGGKAYATRHMGEIRKHQIAAESDFGAGRIYAFRSGAPEYAQGAVKQIAEALAPLGIAHSPQEGGPGPDISPFVEQGLAWASLRQDGTDYFDYHHTANDTLDKVDAKALDQQVAAYAVLAYLAAETTVDFGQLPVKPAAP